MQEAREERARSTTRGGSAVARVAESHLVVEDTGELDFEPRAAGLERSTELNRAGLGLWIVAYVCRGVARRRGADDHDLARVQRDRVGLFDHRDLDALGPSERERR